MNFASVEDYAFGEEFVEEGVDYSDRPALGVDKALEEISMNKNVLYDRTVVEACVKLFSDGRFEL